MEKSPLKTDFASRAAAEQDLSLEKEKLEAARRDPEQFRFFYDKYAGRIGRFVQMRTGDAELARDLTALVFTRALSHLPGFRWQGCTLGAWLFTIATNEIRKHHAMESRLRTVTGAEDQDLAADPQDGQLDHLILSEEQKFLCRCLHNLDEQDQDIFILHYWEGQKTREVAATLGLSENTVKTRLVRGRERLRGMMDPGEGSLAATVEESPDPDLRFAEWNRTDDKEC